MDAEYWSRFYADSKAVDYPTLFARYCIERYLSPPMKVIDLGTGNGRDAIAMGRAGLRVLGIDQSAEAIASAQNLANRDSIPGVEFRTFDFAEGDLAELGGADAYYARFSMHAITEPQQQMALEGIRRTLPPGGFLLVEARTVHDKLYGIGSPLGDRAFFTDHYRRFLDTTEFAAQVIGSGFRLQYVEESTGFAPFGDEDPSALRLVARR